MDEGVVVQRIRASDNRKDHRSIRHTSTHGADGVLMARNRDHWWQKAGWEGKSRGTKHGTNAIPPALDVSPTVSLIPTKLFLLLGKMMLPLVSVPRDPGRVILIKSAASTERQNLTSREADRDCDPPS